MRKKVMSVLLATSLLGAASSEASATQSWTDHWIFSLGAGIGAKWATLNGRINNLTAAANASGKFRPQNTVAEIFTRAYYHRWKMPVLIHLGATLIPHFKRTTIGADFHPTAGTDSFVHLRERWSVSLLLGIEVFKFYQTSFALLAGGNYTPTWLDGTTDETGAGGRFNSFVKKCNNFGGALGAEVRHNLVQYARGGWDVILNYNANTMKSNSIRGTSTTARNYSFENSSGWQHSLKVMFQYRF